MPMMVRSASQFLPKRVTKSTSRALTVIWAAVVRLVLQPYIGSFLLIVRFVLHEVHKRSLTLCGGQYIAALVVRLVDVLPRQGLAAIVGRGSRRVCAFGAALGDVLAIIGLEALFKCSCVFDSALVIQFQFVKQAVSLCKACDRGNPFFRNADFQQDVGQCLFFGSRCFLSVYVGLVVPKSLVLCFILSLVAAVALRFQVVQFLLNGGKFSASAL